MLVQIEVEALVDGRSAARNDFYVYIQTFFLETFAYYVERLNKEVVRSAARVLNFYRRNFAAVNVKLVIRRYRIVDRRTRRIYEL